MNDLPPTTPPGRFAGVYVCLALIFLLTCFTHFVAQMKLELAGQFILINERTLKAMALVQWVAAHPGLALAYVMLACGSIAFLQARGRPRWSWWCTALLYCIPCVIYWVPCGYVAGKLLHGLPAP